MPDLLPLLPLVLAVSGGGLLSLVQPRLPSRLRPFAVPSLLAILLLTVLALVPRMPHSLRAPAMGAAAPYLALTWRLDLVSILPTILVLSGLVAVSLLGKDSPPVASGWDLSMLPVLLVVLWAGNLPTLLVTWAVADVVLLLYTSHEYSPRQGLRVFVAGQIAAMLLLLGFVLGTAEAQDLNPEILEVGEVVSALILAAIGIRLAIFPFHLRWSLRQERSLDLVWQFLVPALLTLTALTRAMQWLSDDIAGNGLFWTWILAALVMNVVYALIESEGPRVVLWATSSLMAIAFAVPLVTGRENRMPLLLWEVAAVGTAIPLFAAALRMDPAKRSIWIRAMWLFGILGLCAFPLTPAFVARIALYEQAISQGRPGFVIIAVVLMTCVLIPLWGEWFRLKPGASERPDSQEWVGIGLLLLPFVSAALWSIFGFSQVKADSALSPGAVKFQGAVDPLLAAALFLADILPPAISFLVARAWAVSAGAIPRWAESIAPAISLERIVESLLHILDQGSRMARALAELIEQHVIGWLIFVALWIAIWLFTLR